MPDPTLPSEEELAPQRRVSTKVMPDGTEE